MSATYLIVDGHSIVFAWPELREVHRTRQAAAREMLCNRLRTLHDAGEDRVVVVFDGKGAKVSSGRANRDDIQIVYSDAGHTADSVIERLAARYAQTHRITVATADRAEQMTACAFGAWCIGPDELRRRLEGAGDAVGRTMRRLRRRADQQSSPVAATFAKR